MKNRNLEHSDNWATPKEFYNKLNNEFNFDFDPCPLCYEEITPEKDGLLVDWGGELCESSIFKEIKRSFCN